MIEDALIQYGAMGLWTISNLTLLWYYIKKDAKRDKRLEEVIENNTIAFTKNCETINNIREVIVKCQK